MYIHNATVLYCSIVRGSMGQCLNISQKALQSMQGKWVLLMLIRHMKQPLSRRGVRVKGQLQVANTWI